MSRVFVDGREYRPVPPAPNIDQTFGAYLSTLRASWKLTQAQAAEALGMSVSQLETLEHGVLDTVPLRTLWTLASFYGVSPDLLVPCYLDGCPRPLRTPLDLTEPVTPDEELLEETEENDDDE